MYQIQYFNPTTNPTTNAFLFCSIVVIHLPYFNDLRIMFKFHPMTNNSSAFTASWTSEEENKLLELRKQNLSARLISFQIPGKSRNAVIGKLHRLGMSAPRVKSGNMARKRKIKIDVMAIKRFILDERVFEAIEEHSVKLIDAQAHHCRWPLPDHHCCGLPAEISPYCAGHALIAYDSLKSPTQ